MTPDPLAARAAAVFARLGGELVDPPTLMDATIPLDLSGEAVRSRLCVFTDARGRDVALRPDLTLPVALEEARARASGAVTGERVRRYVARAFRLPVAEGFDTEFTQVGFERFGVPSDIGADIDTFAIVLEAASIGRTALAEASLGDLSVFPAIIDAVTEDAVLADALKRRFRQGGALDLGADAGPGVPEGGPDRGSGLATLLARAKRSEAEALVREMLAMAGVEAVGARGLDEIVERLLAKGGNGQAGTLSPASRKLLQDLLAMAGPARKTVDALTKAVRKAKLSGLDPLLERLARRIDGLEAACNGLPLHFAAGFGRRFNYYDGFLFEVRAAGAPVLAPLAAGGRYDRLVADLSDGKADATAIGGVVRPDRMALAGGAVR